MIGGARHKRGDLRAATRAYARSMPRRPAEVAAKQRERYQRGVAERTAALHARGLYTVREAAEMLDCSLDMLRHQVAAGKLAVVRQVQSAGVYGAGPHGVRGIAAPGSGAGGVGVSGTSSGALTAGVEGDSDMGLGVYGNSAIGDGVYGVAKATGAADGNGVYGYVSHVGATRVTAGGFGASFASYGVIGHTTAAHYSGCTGIADAPGGRTTRMIPHGRAGNVRRDLPTWRSSRRGWGRSLAYSRTCERRCKRTASGARSPRPTSRTSRRRSRRTG
jgi:hypothetical protein